MGGLILIIIFLFPQIPRSQEGSTTEALVNNINESLSCASLTRIFQEFFYIIAMCLTYYVRHIAIM